MTEYVQRSRPQPRRADDAQDEQVQDDLRDEELTEEVACCLAEIDKMLSETETERERAIREFAEFGRDTTNRELRVWQAKYAHLGLRFGRDCCGNPYVDSEG